MKKTKLGHLLEKATIKLGVFVGKHPILYYILNFTWGLLGNIAGVIVFLCLLPVRIPRRTTMFALAIESNLLLDGHKTQKGVRNNWGFSLGIFFFTSAGAYNDILINIHEFGHSCQNAVFGPFHLFLVEIPSAIRYWHRIIQQRRGKTLTTKYDDIWFEGSASEIGRQTY